MDEYNKKKQSGSGEPSSNKKSIHGSGSPSFKLPDYDEAIDHQYMFNLVGKKWQVSTISLVFVSLHHPDVFRLRAGSARMGAIQFGAKKTIDYSFTWAITRSLSWRLDTRRCSYALDKAISKKCSFISVHRRGRGSKFCPVCFGERGLKSQGSAV
jgi:hypothetical protein